MATLKQSTARVRMFLMVDSTDHITGKTGLTVTVNISKNGGAFAAAAGTVAEIGAGGTGPAGWYKISLTTADTDTVGDLAFHCTATGADPTDFVDEIRVRTIDDAAFPATSGRSLDVDSSGKVLLQPTQTGVTIPTVTTLTGHTAQTGDCYARLGAPIGASISADIAAVKAVLPAALVSGRIDASVGAMASAVITSAAHATGAIDANAFAQAAADKVWGTAARALTDKAGFALADASSDAVIADAVWNALTASYGSAGTYGLLLETDLDATISSRAPSSTALSNAVWTDVKAGYLTGDSYVRLGAPVGASISADIAAVQSDTNDIQTRLPAALVSGRIDASVGAMASGVVTATAIATDAIDADALATDGVAEIVDAVWDELLSGHTGAGSAGKALSDAGTAGDPWSMALPGSYTAGQAGYIVGTNLNATVSSRSTITTAEVNTEVDTALADINLDHLAGTATGIPSTPVGTWIDLILNKDSGHTFDRTTDSLEALRDAQITSAALVDAIWDEARSGHTTAGTFGEGVASVQGNVTGSVASVGSGGITAASFGADAITAAKVAADVSSEIADQVWDELLSGHTGVGSAGAALAAAGLAGDPWSTPLPGSYGAGTAGKIVGDNLNATVSSRAPSSTALSNAVWTDAKAGYLTGDAFVRLGAPVGASISADIAAVKSDSGAIKTKTDQLAFTGANKVDAAILAAGDFAQGAADKVWGTTARALTDKTGFALADDSSDAVIAGAVWDALTSTYGVANSYGALLETQLDGTITSRAAASTALSNAVWTDTRAGKIDNLDAAITTRATPAEVNAEVVDAISTDTYSQLPQANPPAAPTLIQMAMLNYMVLRNKMATSASDVKLYADDESTVVMKRPISDVTDVFTRGELVTGP